jgi:hypothetical protein
VSTRHNRPDDLTDAIDKVTQPGPDAATWTAERPSAGSADSFDAVYLGIRHSEVFPTNRRDADARISRMVGDPYVDHIEPVTGVDFWVGDRSQFLSPLNVIASHAIGALLRAVVAGDYAASDDDRDYARALLNSENTTLLLFGPCVMAGVTHAGDLGPLPEAFWPWLTRYLQKVDTARLGRRVREVMRDQPVRIEVIHRIVILGE